MASAWVYAFMGVLLMERLLETVVARRNGSWIVARGGFECHRGFTRVLLGFHGLWFAAFFLEAFVRKAAPIVHPAHIVFLLVLLQAGRYGCILSLGRFWNTRIFVLPGAAPVRRGLYRWFRHPNYLIVRVEIALYPTLFGCFATALVFGTANLWILQQRIRQEEESMGVRRSRGSRPAAYY